MNIDTRWRLALWQLSFILLSTSWLWAPYLNHSLSYRTALISQYELPGQPYAWLFRLCDMLGATLLFTVALYYRRQKSRMLPALLLSLIGFGLLIDSLFTTTCRLEAGVCVEYMSPSFLLHALETITTATAIFTLAIYDARKRKRLVSWVFVIFQILYGLLFVSQLASHGRFNTLSQFLYQLSLIVWLAWFVGDYLIGISSTPNPRRLQIVKLIFASWAFFNGFLSVLISLADIDLIGKLKGLYFASDNAWLAQHSIVIGVVLLYLSRHLLRGERRARHIFLLITGIEALKYSVITPNPLLLLLYLGTFCALFIFKDAFDRGPAALTWRLRLKEAVFLFLSLTVVAAISLGVLYNDTHSTKITNRALSNFFDYTIRSRLTPDSHLESVLLAHAVTAFLLASTVLVLWVLFRPARPKAGEGGPEEDRRAIELLKKCSISSEDFFKAWPPDKRYFFGKDSFIAYKVIGPIAFALADPIASNKTKRERILTDFITHCRQQGWRVCFLPIYERNTQLYKDLDLNLMQIGASAVIDIEKFLTKTANDKWWRWKKNRAQKEGYVYAKSRPPHSPARMAQFKQVSDAWLTIDGREERGFALGYFDNDYLQKCNIHFLNDSSGNIAAFANQLPIFNESDTATIDLLRYRPDADSSMPNLLSKIIEDISQQGGYKFFDLGFVPFAKSSDPLVKVTQALSVGRFSAKGLEQFKNKFDPTWQPNHIAYDGDLADLALITINLEKALDAQDKAS